MEPESNLRTSKDPAPGKVRGVENDGRGGSGISLVSAHPWDEYLTGPENELAMAAAQAMATGKYDGMSPLVIYGPSGVGKSRLLAGLVAEWLQRQRSSSVAHVDARAFVNACFEAGTERGRSGWLAFHSWFRSVDLFVLEDIEGLKRVPWARDELAYTLDSLETSGAAVAVSAQSSPATWPRETWPHRLVNRLTGGLTARITPPELMSRRRYILQHTRQSGMAIEAEAVEALAEASDGYRTLNGWISRLVLELQVSREQGGRGAGQYAPGGALDSQTVATNLVEEMLLAKPQLTIDVIAQDVADRLGVPLNVLRGPSRRASIVMARHVAMHLARTLASCSFAAIGTYFGGRDPASVRYACRMATMRLDSDPTLTAMLAPRSQGWQKTHSRTLYHIRT
jgi:chromosomal replication initiator protein